MITKFEQFLNESTREEREAKEKLQRKEENKYLTKDERKDNDDRQRKILLNKKKRRGGMNDEDESTHQTDIHKIRIKEAEENIAKQEKEEF